MTAQPAIEHEKTAIRRRSLSRPLELAMDAGLIHRGTDVFDYGCGRGGDVRQLDLRGISATGWDPAYRPEVPRSAADVVNLGYVVNVIEDPEGRAETLRGAWFLTRRLLIVSARLAFQREDKGQPFGDGCLTDRNTFQKFFEQHELRDWIDRTLEVQSLPAAPPLFFSVRNDPLRAPFLPAGYQTVQNKKVS